MRITQSSVYSNFLFDQGKNLSALSQVNTQIANGKNILYGYEDTSIYTEQLRLENREVTLNQAKDVSQKAKEFSNQTDVVLGQFTDVLDSFKTKLIAAANDIHSITSREAIAKELEAMKSNLVSLANTSIAGSYIFSGSRIDTEPFNDSGEYFGNSTSLNALVGSDNQLTYNMHGEDVFFGQDSDYFKSVSTNVKHLNQTELNLDVMTTDRKSLPPSEVFITAEDTIRDLVGDNNDDASDNPNTVFYLRGQSSTGDSVKHKFDLASTDTVSTLLSKIEKAYNDTVEASVNDWGQLVVKDKTPGSSLLEFHIVGATDRSAAAGAMGAADVDDIDDLVNDAQLDIIDFTKSQDVTTKSINTIHAIADKYNDNVFGLNIDLSHVNNFADPSTKIQDILKVDSIDIEGTDITGAGVASYSFAVNSTTTFQNLMDDIKLSFAGNMTDLEVRLDDGKLTFEDTTVDPTKGDSALTPSSFALKMVAKDGADITNAFTSSQGVTLDREYFQKDVTTLTSNVIQYIQDTSEPANNSTKLSQVSGLDSLDKNSFTLNIKDVYGNDKEVFVNLRNDSQNQSLDIAGGAGTDTLTFNENFKDLKIGSVVSDGTSYFKVTDIDLSAQQVVLDGAVDVAATKLEFIEPYQESTLSANSPAATDITQTLTVDNVLGTNSMVLDSMDDQFQVGAKVVDDLGNELTIKEVDLFLNVLEFEESVNPLVTNITLSGQKVELTDNMELNVGDSININGQNVVINAIDDEQNIYIHPANTFAFNTGDVIGAEYSETNSYFEVDGKSYSIFDENFSLQDTQKAVGKNDTQQTTEYNTLTSLEMNTPFDPAVEKGDYIEFQGQYREVDEVYQSINGLKVESDDGTNFTLSDGSTIVNTTPTNTGIAFRNELDYVPGNNSYIDLVKTGLVQLDENFRDIPEVGDYLRVGNDYLEVTDVNLDDKTVAIKPQYDGIIYEDDEIDFVKVTTTKADDVTYKQLSDIIAMVATGNLPVEDNKQPSYYDAVDEARKVVEVGLNEDGQLALRDLVHANTNIELAIYDTNTNKFEDSNANTLIDNQGPALMFQANNALTIDDQHVNFFSTIDKAIEAVREGIYRADSESSNARSTGIQGSIEAIDHLNDHMAKMQTVAGSQTNALEYSIERTEMQVLHIKTLQSEVMDLDLAEASIRLQQVSLNYQAMLSTISKVNKLSLVNYV
jgi:flagellar hook-associated protein 3 FlgL